MKSIFDNVSKECSKLVTNAYSTSFSMATKMLSESIRQDIYNIYGFVRFADEIVDTFHDYDKEKLFRNFETDLDNALKDKISLNPILNSFQETYPGIATHQYHIQYGSGEIPVYRFPLRYITDFVPDIIQVLVKYLHMT